MILLLFTAIFIIIAGAILLIILSKQKKSFGILGEKKRIYVDTETIPGEILYAKSLPLSGKPDSIIKDGKYFIPVEVKTSKTPKDPYLNHTTQLMAYCLLVQETYGTRPPYGYLKYPKKEYKIEYSKKDEERVRLTVYEILKCKKTNREPQCHHKEHYPPYTVK
jgi:CRISPR-associated exonuclease Cas4